MLSCSAFRMKKPSPKKPIPRVPPAAYGGLVGGIADLLEAARRSAARAVNALMTATYWEIGRRIVEFEQGGSERAEYGEELLVRLEGDLTFRFGRGFSRSNRQSMRLFYAAFPPTQIRRTLSGKSRGVEVEAAPSLKSTSRAKRGASRTFQASSGISETPIRKLPISDLSTAFPLPWSHYVRLLTVKNELARDFYHAEALRGAWSVRQLDRQIASPFYERTALSRDKEAMLRKGARVRSEDAVTPDEEVRDPLVLEFLGLKDEYSETDLEEALLQHLGQFLVELGNDFCFVGRQRRLRIGGEWYRVDLLFFHRRLRCLVVIDLKVGRFTHADAGQMHLYLNYARAHWTQPGENPPVGLILCAEKDEAVARYALEGLPNKVLAREYRLALPEEKLLAAEIEKTRERLEQRVR